MNINIIGVPVFYGCDKKGVNDAPKKLRKHGIKEILKENNEVYDLGDIFINECKEKDKYKSNINAKYLKEIVDISTNLAHSIYLTLKNNNFPITIGGDHSLSLGSIAGLSKFYKEDLAVIWIDAHGDFNTVETSPSGNIHGMPLAASAGIGIEELTNIYFSGPKVKFENIFIICARDLDKEESELIRKNGVNIWSTEDVKKLGVNRVILEIMKKINKSNISNVHISFDVDCLDSEVMPGTGTKVDNGIQLDEAINMLEYIFEFGLVKSIDFVEFNPLLDKDNITLKNCLKLIEVISILVSKYVK